MRAKYKSRVAAGLAATVFVGLMWMGDEPADFNSETHDGRTAPCGVITEDGVTDHLAAFQARCHATIEFDGVTYKLDDPMRPTCWEREDGTFLRLQHLHDAPAGLEVLCDTLKGE